MAALDLLASTIPKPIKPDFPAGVFGVSGLPAEAERGPVDVFSGVLPRLNSPIPFHPLTGAGAVASGAVEGVDELIEGVANYFVSLQGAAELGIARTPLAPAVAIKWAKDMIEGGMISSGEALDAYRRRDVKEFAKHVTLGVGMLLGAGGIVGKGVKQAGAAAEGMTPRGQGIASPELKLVAPLTAAEVAKPIAVEPKPAELEYAGGEMTASTSFEIPSSANRQVATAAAEQKTTPPPPVEPPVRAENAPAEFFHGTKSDFDVADFDTTKGAYFSQNRSYAERETMGGGGGKVISVYLEMKNPMVFEKGGRLPTQASFYKLTPEKIQEYKNKGYDSLQLRHPDGTIQEAVVFDKNQILTKNEPTGTIGSEPVRTQLGGVGNRERSRSSETSEPGKPTPEGMAGKTDTGSQLGDRSEQAELRSDAQASGRPLTSEPPRAAAPPAAKTAEPTAAPEKIVQAAVRVNGEVFTGSFHGEAWGKAAEAGKLRREGGWYVTQDGNRWPSEDAGLYVTDRGRILESAEAQSEFGVTNMQQVNFPKGVPEYTQNPPPSPAGEKVDQTGLGAAVPSEFEPARKFTTKTTVEQINKERKERGLGPLEEHEVFGNKAAVAEAKKLMDENPDTAEQILARLREKPETALEPTERAVMVIHRAELLNSYYRALKNWREHFEGDDLVRAAQEAEIADFYSKKLAETESLVSEGGAGTAAGRSLQAIKIGIAEDYSLDMMTLKAMKAKGESLTPEEGSRIVKEHEGLTAKIKKLEEELAKEKERGTNTDSESAVDDAVKAARARQKKDKSTGSERDLEAEHADVIARLKESFIENEASLAGQETTIRKLMELIVEREGITDRLKMEDRVHEILTKEVDPTITRQEAMDLMSQYGKSRLPSPEFAKKTVRDIVAQILSVRKLLDYVQGQRPKLTGQLRDAPSDIQRGLIKMVNEAKKAFKLEGPTDNARAIKSALDAINTRLKNRISDLKQEIATRVKIVRERNPSPYNAETLRMRQEILELEKAHKEIFGKTELTDAQRLELLEKSAERQIAELERQLRTGEIFPKIKIPFKGESEKLSAARARLEELKATREFARESAQPRPEPEAVSVETRVKSLDKQIAEIEKQISDEAVFPKSKTAKEPSADARVLEREKKLSDLKEQRQFIRERIQPKPELASKALEQRAESLRKKIEEIQRQMRDGDIFPKGKKLTEVEKNDLIRAREAELDTLKEQRQWARDAAQPKIEPAEKFLLNYLLRLRQREAQYRERIAKGDFEKRVKRPRELSPDVLRAKVEVEAAKQDFNKGVMEFEMARRSKLRKVWDGIKQTKNAFVNIKSSYDLSAPRQMFLALLANASRLAFSPLGLLTRKIPGPAESARLAFIPLGRMFSALKSERRSQELEQWRKTRPNATSGSDKLSEIQYTELHTADFTKWEEFAHSVLDEWAQLPIRTGSAVKTAMTFVPKLAAKGVRASNRAFITALNTQRAMLFDHLLEVNFKDRAPTEADLKVIGNLVNVSTGRGKLSRGVSKATGEFLWSPSLLASRVQALIGQPLWGGGPLKDSARARKVVAKEYARWIMSGTALLAISRMFDDKDETNLTSSDAGKIVRGKTRIDVWAGFTQPITLTARISTGKKKSSDTDKERNIAKFGTGEVIWNFFKNKARPDIAAIVKVTIAAIDSGKPAKDVRITIGEAAKEAVPIPLSVQEVIAVMKDRGMTEGAIIQTLSTFGVGVNTYDDKESQK